MDNKLVSVVIPFYRNLTWLTEAVESVFSQTYKYIELVIVNDGSPENDFQFEERFASRIRYFKTENKGASSARNLGIEHANGEYIAFLDSDDLWQPEKIEKQVCFMEENNCSWSHTSYYLFNDKGGVKIKDIDVSNFCGDVFLKCFISSPIATPCVMVRRNVFFEFPELRFNEYFNYGEDGLLWLNIAKFFELGVLPDILTGVRIRGVNAAQRARVYLEARAQLWTYVKSKSKTDSRFSDLPRMINLALMICSLGFKAVRWAETSLKLSGQLIEITSKALYLLPYLLFKFLKHSKIYNVQK